MNGATRWLWSGLGLVVCGLLPAQQQMEAVGDLERQGAPVELSFRAINGARLGGLGYLLVYGKRKAVGGDPLLSLVSTRLQLGYSTSPYDHGDVRLDGDIVLPGGTGRSVFLPLPSLPGVAGYFRGSVAGLPFSEYFEIAEDSTSQPDAILFVTRVGERSATVAQAFGGNRDNFRSVAPDELPADWALLSTFRVVVIDESVVLGEGPQEVLRRFAVAGGAVVALGDQPLGAGPLREQLAAQQQPVARTGFGLLARAESVADAVRTLPEPLSWQREWAGVLPSQFAPGEIPGLGGVPVRAFLLIILLFTVAVGPVNFLLLRRRKQQLLAVFTVPLLGFGTTAAMLGYGVFQDGLGIQGVARSISILDQQRHEVAASTSQTLFAGLGPGQLDVPVGTVVQSLPALLKTRSQTGLSSLRYTLGRPVVGGQLLPSRTLTTLVTTQQQPERARLRFAMAGDRTVLAAEDFVLGGPGMLVVRDLQGQHYEERDGELLPCSEARAAELVGQILSQYAAEQRRALATHNRVSYRELQELTSSMTRNSLQEHLRTVLGLGGQGQDAAGPLQPGSYLGAFKAVPWLDDHGLEIHYHQQVHLVRGDLSSEDFVQ